MLLMFLILEELSLIFNVENRVFVNFDCPDFKAKYVLHFDSKSENVKSGRAKNGRSISEI